MICKDHNVSEHCGRFYHGLWRSTDGCNTELALHWSCISPWQLVTAYISEPLCWHVWNWDGCNKMALEFYSFMRIWFPWNFVMQRCQCHPIQQPTKPTNVHRGSGKLPGRTRAHGQWSLSLSRTGLHTAATGWVKGHNEVNEDTTSMVVSTPSWKTWVNQPIIC